MTYVRRYSRLLADQIRPFETRDILWITVDGMTTVNFYRQNDKSDALNTLLRWPIPERCLVAGDFNARHHTWQTGQATNRGQEIADWASEHELSLLNILDIPTNPHGNTIDLAFTNVPLAEATVSWSRRTPPVELGELASSLASLLTSAAKAAGRPARKGGRSAPWWTEECAAAMAGFRAIRRLSLSFNQNVQVAKRDFHRVARRAKRQYWRNLIDSFTSNSAFLKAVRWLKPLGAFQPPSLQVNNVVYETQMDKANALQQASIE
ncbi:hypothetical protein Forpe1208_v016317 [Fusarium oxysporum f. sp. rapae]|uniref:Endonuclease/exonuclease/phosphatase domain-containing protein n=1 Tax=Fusarium oxysporum f. sp. rapae TaxID=485398 RepID=A0A8J5NIK1_FUSOX|nr:hypothetical protein Forpe1208_v016317 [Fusarium oxysporum f. sp. rapae]